MILRHQDIYGIVLRNVEVRKYFHPKHLSKSEIHYEGLRRIREELGLFKS